MSGWGLYPEVGREILTSSRASVGPPDPPMFAGIMSSIARAFPAAYNESLSAITGIATEYGRAAAFTQGAKYEESIDLLGSPAPIADQFRAQAKRLTPDPMTTGAASRFVFDATRVLTKAAALGIAGGPMVAAVGTGGLEGTLESQKLRDQGVDAFTAAAVGTIKGVGTGVSLALPIAGRTLLETAGIVAIGGPVSFMAEKAAARAVLEHADYSAIAHEYDPFDPLGLALSVAVPGIFGAAVHGARAVGAARARARPSVGEEEVDAARALQTAQHVDETRLADPGNATGADAHAEALTTARAQIDAGERVSVADVVPLSDIGAPGLTAAERVDLALERARGRVADIELDPQATFRPGTPAADMVGEAAIARARQIVGAARFGELTDRAIAEARNFHELTAQRQITPAEVTAEIEHVARQVIEQKHTSSLQPEIAAILEDPDVRAAIISMRSEAGWAEVGGKMIREPSPDGLGEVTGRTAWVANAEWWPGRPDGLNRRAVQRAVDKAIAGDNLTAAEARTIQYMSEYARERILGEPFHATADELGAAGLRDGADQFDAAMVARAAALDEARVEQLAITHGDNDAAFMRAIKEMLDESDTSTFGRGESGAREEGGGQGARETGEGADPVTEAAKNVVDTAPDLRVIDELTGEEVTAAELYRRAEEVYQVEAREADAYGAAVECFLRSGA